MRSKRRVQSFFWADPCNERLIPKTSDMQAAAQRDTASFTHLPSERHFSSLLELCLEETGNKGKGEQKVLNAETQNP